MAEAAEVRDAAESMTIRRYRHVLRTAPLDWQESAHRRALLAMNPEQRVGILGEVRRLLGTGFHLHTDEVHHIARLIVRAERRAPRIILGGLDSALLDQLAEGVLGGSIGRTLDGGQDIWDGVELVPDPAPPVTEAPTWSSPHVPQGDVWGAYCNLYGSRFRDRNG